MTKLDEILDINQLVTELQDGFVRERNHPANPELKILNYTEKAQYDRHWNEVTRQCRGLIVDFPTGEVLARPFDKFFNVGEHLENIFAPEAIVTVTDKADGSLGILYTAPDGLPAIATRGSFLSDQAIHATEVLRTRYADFRPEAGLTYLFEIVFPENRIVLDYGDLDDLILLGMRNIETGRTHGPGYSVPGMGAISWRGPRIEQFPVTTYREALELGDRENREGLVITFANSGLMVKVKQEDYVRLHKLVTGLNERAVWEHLSEHNGNFDGLLASVPDEFHEWVRNVAENLLDQFETLSGRAHHAYHHTVNDIADDEGFVDRKTFALSVRNHYASLSGLLFQLLDGRDISPAVWKTLKPKGETASLLNRNEDNS